MDPERSAGEMLTLVIVDLTDRMQDLTPAALTDEPDAVHQLRTTVRRLRNVVAAFKKLLEPEPTARLRSALSDYGARLGESRDLEVRADHCADALETLGLDDELRGPLVEPLLAAHEVAHRRLVAWHRSPDQVVLADRLECWATAPPITARGERPAERVATKAVRKQVDRTVAAAHHLIDADDAEELHELRKAARRLRHTVDAVTDTPGDVLSGDVAGWAGQVGVLGTDIQRMLGDERDALLLAGYVRDRMDGVTDAASYLMVVAHAEQEARRAVGALPGTVLALRDARHP